MTQEIIRVGDRVTRKSGKSGRKIKPEVGIVERVFVPTYADNKAPRARIHWLSGQRRIGGGKDFHTTMQVGALVKVEEIAP